MADERERSISQSRNGTIGSRKSRASGTCQGRGVGIMHGGVHGRAFNPSNNRNISGGAQWPAQIYLLYTRYDATYPHVRCRVAEPLERTTQRVTVRRPAGY